jgi:hypothetical protein
MARASARQGGGAFFVVEMGCEVLHQLKCHVGWIASHCNR